MKEIWAKVEYKEFIRHFRKMNDEMIIADIRQSMDDLEERSEFGTSFGAKMVKWTNYRIGKLSEINRTNGKLGGRPSNKQIQLLKLTKPPTIDKLYDFATEQGLDDADAREWYEMTFTDRNGKDKNGEPIKNWQGALKRFCQSRKRKREMNDEQF